MRLRLFHLDAFSGRAFAGNPAAVVPLDEWLPDRTLQAIAAENNLSETAFLVGGNGEYEIRWMTPTTEVDLCGHATLAAAYVVSTWIEPGCAEVHFHSQSGPLAVTRTDDLLTLDFPARPPRPAEVTPEIVAALRARPTEVWVARDLLCLFGSEDEVRGLQPDMALLAGLPQFATMVTAPGREVDFVSRFFAPAQGIPEDPVTGSAHCTLIPFWAKRLSKTSLRARQVSARGGELWCELAGDRVKIGGQVAKYLEGWIEVP
jgi:predicted PhzF superfamily epimerase YddE/YHI9